MTTSTRWTTPEELRSRLLKRWQRGELLTAWACDEPFTPIDTSLRGPTTDELTTRFDEVRAWISEWRRFAETTTDIRISTRRAGARSVGANELPDRVVIDSYSQLWRLLRVDRDVREFDHLRSATAAENPDLVDWMTSHPMKVLAHTEAWTRLVQTTSWLALHEPQQVYLRQVAVPGVDTKFIERHRQILATLLDLTLPAERINPAFTPADFAQRYGYLTKPFLVRFRSLDPARPAHGGVRELAIPAEDFPRVVPDVSTVFIIENEATYLAFPEFESAIALFGGGYGASVVARLPWLENRRAIYWGDFDTHGFAILNQVRGQLPHVTSMLMDTATLLSHRTHWSTEPMQTRAHLPNLTAAEAQTYGDLIEDIHGRSLRLEQERIEYPLLMQHLDNLNPGLLAHEALDTGISATRDLSLGHISSTP